MDARRSRQSKSAETQAKIVELMKTIAGDPFLLYEVVAAGAYQFRLIFLRAFRGYAVDENVADLTFRFFCQQVIKRHPDLGSQLTPQQASALLLDTMEVKSPPTAEEVDRSWVHEVFSSEEGRRAAYLDGAGMAGQDHKVIIRN